MIFILSFTYTHVGAFTPGEVPLLTHVPWKKVLDKGEAGFLPLTPSPIPRLKLPGSVWVLLLSSGDKRTQILAYILRIAE